MATQIIPNTNHTENQLPRPSHWRVHNTMKAILECSVTICNDTAACLDAQLTDAVWHIYASVNQAIIWTKSEILLIRLLLIYLISIPTKQIWYKKNNLKMSSVKWRPFCLGLNVLKICLFIQRLTLRNFYFMIFRNFPQIQTLINVLFKVLLISLQSTLTPDIPINLDWSG